MSAASLLAKVKARKQQLQAQFETWDTTVSNKIYTPSQTLVEPAPPTLWLTKTERAKQRKLNKLQAQEKLNEEIKLGITKPAEPKLTLKNVAHVFKDEFINDPTHFELLAQQQQEQRHLNHLQKNEERKNESKLKRQQKYVELENKERLYCIAINIKTKLINKHQFIINDFALKNKCSGALLLSDSNALLVLEMANELNVVHVITKLGVEFDISFRGRLRRSNFRRWSVHTLRDRLNFLRVYKVETMFPNEHERA